MSNSSESRAIENQTQMPGVPRTKWDAVVDLLVAYKRYIAGVIVITVIAGMLGWIDLPQIQFWGWFLIGSTVAGMTLGSSAVLYELRDHLKDDRILVGLAPANSDITDIIKFPKKTFRKFDVVGKRFPQRRTVAGETVYTVRAVDFDKHVMVPALEFPDEKYPDDIDLISEDADASKIDQLRDALLEDARAYQGITVDKEVIRESAMGDTVQIFAKGLQKVRDGHIDVQEMTNKQLEVQAEQFLQEAQGAGLDKNTGGGDGE